jgi:hypothetical protein
VEEAQKVKQECEVKIEEEVKFLKEMQKSWKQLVYKKEREGGN